MQIARKSACSTSDLIAKPSEIAGIYWNRLGLASPLHSLLTLRVAIPIFGVRISPLLDVAQRLMLVETESWRERR